MNIISIYFVIGFHFTYGSAQMIDLELHYLVDDILLRLEIGTYKNTSEKFEQLKHSRHTFQGKIREKLFIEIKNSGKGAICLAASLKVGPIRFDTNYPRIWKNSNDIWEIQKSSSSVIREFKIGTKTINCVGDNNGKLNQRITYSIVIPQIYKSTIDSKLIKDNNNTYINISECKPLLREKYRIPDNQDLYIYVIDQDPKEESKQINFEYEVYWKGDIPLDLSICDSRDIITDIPLPMTPEAEEKFKEAQEFKAHGIDVYNPQDPFFNDICIKSPLDNDTDIPRQDRISKYLQNNQTVCPSNCKFISMDYESVNAKCKCSSVKNDELSFDGIKDNLLATLLETNVEVIFCYKLVFDMVIFKQNIGCWVLMIIGGLIMINLLIILCTFINPLKTELNIHHRRIEIHNIENNEQPVQPSEYNNNQPVTQMIQPVERTIQSIRQSAYRINIINHLRPNQIIRIETKQTTIVKTTPLDLFDFDEMSFEEAITDDTRTFMIVYWNYIQLFHPIISTFFVKNKRSLKTVKIAKFFIGIMLDLALSAFFYSDKYISNNYNKNGSFLYDLPVSLYTYLLGSVINVLISQLIDSDPGASKIYKLQQHTVILSTIETFLKCYRIRMYVFNVLQLIVAICLLYYVSAFCAVYTNSQIEWIKSCGISLGISMLIPFGICVILTIIQKISLKYKCKCLYKLVSFISLFF